MSRARDACATWPMAIPAKPCNTRCTSACCATPSPGACDANSRLRRRSRDCVPRFSLPADVAKHVGMNVQADVGHVVVMLAGYEPYDFANLPLRIIGGHALERVGFDVLV